MDLAGWHDWWKHYGASEVRHVLLLWWDPIGVYGASGAVDEYDGYSGHIARMLRAGTDAARIASYLGDVAVNRMRLRSNPRLDGLCGSVMARLTTRSTSVVAVPVPVPVPVRAGVAVDTANSVSSP